MIIPPLGGIAAESALTQAGGLAGGPQGGIGADSALAETGGLTEGAGVGGEAFATGTESVSFGSALTNAISSLEQTQQSAAGAAHGLAMGTVSDPESAVVTVEDAQLAMQLASQIRTKATEAAQSIFQTQV